MPSTLKRLRQSQRDVADSRTVWELWVLAEGRPSRKIELQKKDFTKEAVSEVLLKACNRLLTVQELSRFSDYVLGQLRSATTFRRSGSLEGAKTKFKFRFTQIT